MTDGSMLLYRLYDNTGTLLYVGITNDLTKRLQTHARQARWWADVNHARTITEAYPDRSAAEIAERVAMTADRPVHNYVNSPWRKPRRLPTGDTKLYSAEAAEMVGVSASTWRGYCTEAPGRRRQAPPEDGTDVDKGHARPWWWESTLRQWMTGRPGRGSPGRPRTRMAERLREGAAE